jgi:hypothetical protein
MKNPKQVHELSVDDLREYPIWQFVRDDDEEPEDAATVRPFPWRGPLDPTDGMFVVQAVFVLAGGTSMTGYLTPPQQRDASVGAVRPVIVTDHGQVSFWYGVATPDATVLSRNYRLLGKRAPEIFPLRYGSAVVIVGGPVAGVIGGFMYYERPAGAASIAQLLLKAVR